MGTLRSKARGVCYRVRTDVNLTSAVRIAAKPEVVVCAWTKSIDERKPGILKPGADPTTSERQYVVPWTVSKSLKSFFFFWSIFGYFTMYVLQVAVLWVQTFQAFQFVNGHVLALLFKFSLFRAFSFWTAMCWPCCSLFVFWSLPSLYWRENVKSVAYLELSSHLKDWVDYCNCKFIVERLNNIWQKYHSCDRAELEFSSPGFATLLYTADVRIL